MALKRLMIVSCLLVAAPQLKATVAFDAISNVAAGTGNLSWTHTPAGTPKGVLVFVVQNASGAGQVSSVTYGSASMTEVTGSPNLHTTGETGAVYAYFLGTSVPTGAQTVTVTVSGSATKRAVCITLTATEDTAIVTTDASIKSDSLANPSVLLSLSGQTSFVAIGFHSGQGAVSGITELTNWTNRLEHDFGAQTAGWYTYNTIGSADVTAGWTQTADDAVMIAVAVKDTAVPPAIEFKQAAYNNGTGSSLSATFGSATTTGDAIVVGINWYNDTTISSVSDSNGNTYNLVTTVTQTSTHKAALYYALNITGGASHQVTVTFSGSSDAGISVAEYSGFATSGALDQYAGASGASGTALNSGNVTTTQATEMLIGWGSAWNSVTFTPGTNFTERTDNYAASLEDRYVTSTGTYAATFTASGESGGWTAIIATFGAQGAPPAAPGRRRILNYD